jgi:hypothetical protein
MDTATADRFVAKLSSAELRIHSLRTTFIKSSTFRFMVVSLTFRCCSMLMPVKKVKIISASTVGFVAGFSASTRGNRNPIRSPGRAD